MDLAVLLLAGALLVAILALGWLGAYRLWRQIQARGSPLMDQVLDRHSPPAQAAPHGETLIRAAAAARTCLLCRDQAVCLAWLEGETAASLQQFCPNAELIEHLSAPPKERTQS
jgi:hypothetical protein